MADIKCFLVVPSEHVVRSLRVDSWRPCDKPSYEGAKCWARVDFDTITEPYALDERGIERMYATARETDEALKTDASVPWPTACERCGQAFADLQAAGVNIYRYVDRERMWRNTETGEEFRRLHESLPGAMWRAPWLHDFCTSQDDGAPLCVMTPGGEWLIDSQASNCTQRDDRHQDHHHCWVRHGQAPQITVDKAGISCGAGAGSILAGSYHGFLRNGYLTNA